MRNFTTRGLTLAAITAAVVLAGCSGSGRSAVPSAPSSASLPSSQTVAAKLTFLLPNVQTASSTTRSPQYLPTTAQSVVIKYIGDNPSATPAPGSSPPATAITAGSANLTTTGSGSNCTSSSAGLTCTVTVSFVVGNVDIYIQAFSGTNGTGTLLAYSVSTLYVNSNGTLTVGGPTGATATPAPLGANTGGTSSTVTLTSAVALPVSGTPNPAATLPTSVVVPQTSGYPVVVSGGALSYLDAAGNAVPSNVSITPVTITSADTTGNTCLIYVKAGGTSGTTTYSPCAFPSSGSTPAPVTLVNSSDTYAIQYNNRYEPLLGFKVSATVSGSSASATPAPATITVNPTHYALGSGAAAGSATTGAIAYDSVGKNVYAGTFNASDPLAIGAYSTSTGYGAVALMTALSSNVYPDGYGLTISGATLLRTAAANALTGNTTAAGVNKGVVGLAMGSDNNLWVAEGGQGPTGATTTGCGGTNPQLYPQVTVQTVGASGDTVTFTLDGVGVPTQLNTTSAGSTTAEATAIVSSINGSTTIGPYISASNSAGVITLKPRLPGGAFTLAIGNTGTGTFNVSSGTPTTAAATLASSELDACTLDAAVYASNGTAITSVGTTIAKGSIAEFALYPSSTSATLTGVASLGGYIWVTDSVGDLWRISSGAGTVVPNLGTSSTASSSSFKGSTTATPIKTSTNGTLGSFVSNLIPFGTTTLFTTGGTGPVLEALTIQSAAPSTTQPLAVGSAGSNALNGTVQAIATDGTNIYVQGGTALYAFSPTNFTETPALQAFSSTAADGLTIAADGSFWTLAQSAGAEWVAGLAVAGKSSIPNSTSSTTTALGSTSLCNSTAATGSAGINGLTLGPDNTLLFAPVGTTAATTTFVCGVTY